MAGAGAEARTVEFAHQSLARVSLPRDLGAIRDIANLTPHIPEAVSAVTEGIQTSQEFAKARGISIANASERFRAARRRGWIVPDGGRYLRREGVRFMRVPSGSSG